MNAADRVYGPKLVQTARAGMNAHRLAEADLFREGLPENIPEGLERVFLDVDEPPMLLAGLSWCWERGLLPFLGNPAWGERERRQIRETLGFHGILHSDGWSLCGSKEDADGGSPPADRAMLALATGGSTGAVRFALHGRYNLQAAARSYGQAFGSSGGPLISALPLFHVSGWMPLVRAVELGAPWHWIAPGEEALISYLKKKDEKGGHLSLVPTQLQRLQRHPEVWRVLADLEALFLGGTGVSVALGEFCKEQGIPLAVSYGMTETAAMVAVAKDWNEQREWVFKPLPGNSFRSEEGELWVRTKGQMIGYFGASPFSSGKWWRTGDAGEVQDEGSFILQGRRRLLTDCLTATMPSADSSPHPFRRIAATTAPA